ncbi:hypothetical protein ONZ43_g4891 [Nemania bipapillata]|uniref:Uncharacterized protein n=1 Tax=Nemania bipapillata TaxID=110536 RepID=A0ACC2IH36_9PEZI|nr:hypothetical protein ONZ43_g4891 [Nemania bipapillata]
MSEEEEDLSKPYSPFAGLGPALEPSRYHLSEAYPNSWLEPARTNDDHRVPGYSISEYVARAMFDAFAGLGVNIADEKKEAPLGAGTIVADTAVSNRAPPRTGSDDVFG